MMTRAEVTARKSAVTAARLERFAAEDALSTALANSDRLLYDGPDDLFEDADVVVAQTALAEAVATYETAKRLYAEALSEFEGKGASWCAPGREVRMTDTNGYAIFGTVERNFAGSLDVRVTLGSPRYPTGTMVYGYHSSFVPA